MRMHFLGGFLAKGRATSGGGVVVSTGAKIAPVSFVVVPESEILLWPEEYGVERREVSLMIKL